MLLVVKTKASAVQTGELYTVFSSEEEHHRVGCVYIAPIDLHLPPYLACKIMHVVSLRSKVQCIWESTLVCLFNKDLCYASGTSVHPVRTSLPCTTQS